MPLEKDLAAEVKMLLDQYGITYLVHRTDKRSTGTKGWPDISFAYQGQPVVWELKTKKGVMSEAQVYLHEKLADAPNRWNVWVIRSLDDAMKSIYSLQCRQN